MYIVRAVFFYAYTMEEDELLDQQETKKVFSKNLLLYALASVTFAGYAIRQMHWPGSAWIIIVGGGMSTGYMAGLLFFFRQHYLFENVGMVLYSGIIARTIYQDYNQDALFLFSCTALIVAAVTIGLLRGREIT